MEITIKGTQEEIAALVLAVQGRQKGKSLEVEHKCKKRIVTVYKNGKVFKKWLDR